MRNRFLVFVTAVGILLTTGCATNFSAPGVRAEIARQTGAMPRESFEVYAGPLTMTLARHLMGNPSAPKALMGSRVTAFEIAVYEFAPKAGADAPVLDFTLMPVRGWEPSLRFSTKGRSGMLLVRTSGESVADLVILVSDKDGAIYGRLSGTISKELTAALGKAVQSGGTDDVRHELESLPDEK